MQPTPTRNRLPDTAPAETVTIASLPSTSKELRWDSCLPPATRTLLQNREMRRRTILVAACAIFFLVVLYANTSLTHQKAKLVLEWESARSTPTTLHAARAASSAPHIPRIIHQSWTDEGPIPPQWQAFSSDLRARHPDWDHRLWSEDDTVKLIKEHYAWLMPFYSNLPGNAQRADVAKYLYMHRFGGVYLSMGAYCARQLDALLGGFVVLAPGGGASVSVSFMASEPGQPFWPFVVSKVCVVCSVCGAYVHTTGGELCGGWAARGEARQHRWQDAVPSRCATIIEVMHAPGRVHSAALRDAAPGRAQRDVARPLGGGGRSVHDCASRGCGAVRAGARARV